MPPRCHPHSSKGFTLIEVLVAILVLSFGMLGLVGMQAFALKSNRDAKFQAEGTNLARELAEMMRGNNLIAIKTTAADNPYLTTTLAEETSAETCLSATTVCSTQKAVAAAQMTEWRARVRNTLPGARVAICFDSQPYDSQGLPQWACTDTTSGSDQVIVLKLGWTQFSTDSSTNNANAQVNADSDTSRPQIVVPVTGGNPYSL